MSDEPGLQVVLESHLPADLPAGHAGAVFVFGHCFHPSARVRELRLRVDGASYAPAAWRMPRRDLLEWLSATGGDPEGHSYRSGFWATLPLPASPAGSTVAIDALVQLDHGGRYAMPLGLIEVRNTEPAEPGVAAQTIAICLASYEPDPALFRTQIESLRAQTDGDWVCVISDGGSSEPALEAMRAVLGDDPRFSLHPAKRRLGPYRNFERALCLAPTGAGLVAPCDQDDRWHSDKLATLRTEIGPAGLVFSDSRLVDRDGTVLGDTLWRRRRNDHANLASLLVANAVPGASMLLRRDVADLALPFPQAPGDPFHDHWLALVALATNEIRYVDRPLYDYVQHTGGVVSHLPSSGDGRRSRELRRPANLRGAYFAGYVSRAVFAQALLTRCAHRLSARKRRALEWFLASERHPVAFGWLALRPLRRLVGRDETLSGEWPIVKGILWRWLLTLATVRRERPGRMAADARFPDPAVFDQPRLRRWRAGS